LIDRLASALSDCYRIERELGQGGMAYRSVAKATAAAADRPRVHHPERNA